MNILALDLGTNTGWATLINGVEDAGTVVLASDKELRAQKAERMDRRNDIRVTRLFDWIGTIRNTCRFDWAFFEDVQFLSTQLQAQLWAGLRSSVWLHGGKTGELQIDCVPVGTLKKFATGSGSATKDMMGFALGCEITKTGVKSRPFSYTLAGRSLTDDEIDARHLLRFAREKLKV